MKDKLEDIKKEALEKLNQVKKQDELDGIRVEFLGKKGRLTSILRSMGSLSKEERPIVGKLANEVREEIEKVLEEKKKELEEFLLFF